MTMIENWVYSLGFRFQENVVDAAIFRLFLNRNMSGIDM